MCCKLVRIAAVVLGIGGATIFFTGLIGVLATSIPLTFLYIWIHGGQSEIKWKAIQLELVFLLQCLIFESVFQMVGVAAVVFLLLVMAVQGSSIVALSLGRRKFASFLSLGMLYISMPICILACTEFSSLKAEVTSILTFAETARTTTGSYPSDLSAYTPLRARLLDKIEYSNVEEHLMVYYFLVPGNAMHYYSMTSGWGVFWD